MKKKLFSLLLGLVLLLPLGINAKEKVKVYIFESGGCPYCEAQIEYLEGLPGYNETFTIERKELYVDHIDWAQGKDYELGKIVAEEFNKVGFDEATYQGTPFVVISDLYAKAALNQTLESVINEAYELGDKDIVGCYESGKTGCLDHLLDNDTTVVTQDNSWLNVLLTAIIVVTIIVTSNKNTNKIVEALESNNKKSSK